METKIKPLGLNMLVKPLPEEDLSAQEQQVDGIILPQATVANQQAKQRTILRAEVIRVGDGKKGLDIIEDFSNIPIGATVFIGQHAGMPVFENGVEYRMIERQTVLGIIED